ncbi:MAG: tetratricopeptide repeat protein [Anaerolineales bacterium]|nr:tetratricopeptide repeat protein [Anaerolineales bacterium]
MTPREDLFEESMQLGHSAAWEQDWERAIEFYRKALAEAPENADALTSLGLALLETDREKEALTVYHKACKAAPEDPIPFEKCAEIFESLGQTEDAVQQREAAAERYMRRRDAEKAVENWTHVGRLAPNNLKARSRLALTNERLGRRKEAVHEYLAVASILQSAGRTERAREAVQRALSIIPGDPEATQAMRTLQDGDPLGDPSPPKGATKPLRMSQVKAILDSPPEEELSEDGAGSPLEAPVEDSEAAVDDPELDARQRALSILAGLLFEEPESAEDGGDEDVDFGSLVGGISGAKGEAVAQPAMYRYLGKAIDLQTREKKQEAVKEFQRAVQAGLDHPAAHYALGYLLKDLENYDEAREHLKQAVPHPELALGANLALGRMCRSAGDMTEAAHHLVQALRIADTLSVDETKSDELSQLYDSILATQDEGDEEALTKIVENTLEFLSGPEWLSRVRQARQQLRGESGDTSVVPIARMIAVGGSDRVVNALQRIDELANQGLFVSAMEETMLSLQHAPSYLPLHRRMAELQLRTGDTDAGVQKLTMLAETHKVRGEAGKAADVYARLLRESPVEVDARARLIELLQQQDRIDEALDHYVQLADLYRQLAQIDSAREALNEAYEQAKQAGAGKQARLKILHKMGDIDAARLDWRRALEDYRQIRELAPDDPEARAKIIDLNLRLGNEDQAAEALDEHLEKLVQNERGGEALELLEELAREHPGKQVLHARLADAYRAAGRKADAIAQYDALGEIQLDSGQTEAAVRTIKKIIELEPPDIEGYRELLRNVQDSE